MISLCSVLIGLAVVAQDEEAFRANVRTTEPQSAQAQQRTFQLPPGFEIQLFAAEPDLQKPMNMAFDAAGRLWVSGSVEYPYAAADGQGRDTIKVLADTDGDGRADQISTFVDGLNIPMGLYPYRDGVVAYSIPNIWFFRDTDGDGRADRREILYGPMTPPRDTHGMQNAFRRGFDGWLYVNHGFANETTISGRDGSSIQLQSGNTYRVRLDGSRVEQITWGQVNPFGSTFLPDGDLITADCHSRPLTLLLRGAYYPSFGKPHDGLGFAPDLMQHSHGSTAIAGVVHYTGDNFPAEYHGHLFVGNVMTSRINHDVLQYAGATPRAIEQPDFLKAGDPWFRPVDLQLGPDGALYIADFYNRIIGHYEVPLEHPGRDKHHARIWRIVYRGDQGTIPAPRSPDLSRAGVEQLVDVLAHPSLTRRMLATDQLTDRLGDGATARLQEALHNHPSETVRAHSLWALFRLGRLTFAEAERARRDAMALVRIHALRVLSESPQWKVELGALGRAEASPLERRAAAGAVAQQQGHDVPLLLDVLLQTGPEDALQRHAWRLALRNQLRAVGSWTALNPRSLAADRLAELASIAIAVPGEASALFLLEYIREHGVLPEQVDVQLAHLCQHLPADRLPAAIDVLRDKTQHDDDLQLKVVLLAHQRVQQRGGTYPPTLQDWGSNLAWRLLGAEDVAPPATSPSKRAERLASAWSIVGALRLQELRPKAARILNDRSADWVVRAAAAHAALAFAPRPLLTALASVVSEASLDEELRNAVCRSVAESLADADPKLLSDAMQAASARVQHALADSLASTPAGGESLLRMVEQGHAAPRLLQDPAIRQKLTRARVRQLEDRLARLTSSLPPADAQVQRLIIQRRRSFVDSAVNASRGQELFGKHCAACHQVAGQGALIGPQLDGIGNRGADRVIEDVLDPNRNVDATFHLSVLTLTNGQTVTGLFRREEGGSLIFANQEGKEFVVLRADIDEQVKTTVSLMPANAGELLQPDEFRDLIGYLLTLRGR